MELGNTVVAENTTAGKAEFADLRGWFFNTTAAARNTLRLTGYTARPQPGNVVGVLDTGATLFNTSAAVTVAANGTSTTPLVPGLGALADHGGGLLTRVPQAGSVLIDITNTGGYTELQSLPGVATNLDERGSGFARRAGFTLDAGAVEVQNPGTFLVVPALPGQFGPPQQVTAPNSLFPQPITVSAQDEYGLPVTTQKVELQFNPVGSGVGATFPLGSKLVINPDAPATAGSGSGFVYLAARPVVGTFTQTASFGGQQLGFRLYVRPGLGSSDVIRPTLPADGSVPAQFQAVVGTDYAPLSVTVRDSSGTPLAGATVTFTVVLPAGGKGSDNPFAVPAVSASGSFTAGGDPAVVSQLATVTSDASGVATITLKAGTKAGLVTVLVSATATNTNGLLQVAANDTVTLQNLPDVASRVSPALPDADGNEQSGNGQLVRILSAPAKPLVFLVSDQYLNPRPGVTVTLNDLDTGRLAGLANDGVTAVSDADGRATFSAATGNAAVANAQVEAAPYTVRASAGELVADVQLTNVPGLPAGLAILDGNNQSAPVSDSRVAVGESNQFPSLLRVRVTDAGGNPVPAGTVISFTGVGIRFESARVPTGDDGVAEVRVAPSEQAGTFTATALADTGASATFTLTATAGLPTSVAVIAGDAQTARAGATLSPVRVQVLDQYQNPVPGVAVTVAGGGGTFTSTLTGADGRSTVTVVAGAVAGQYTASASVGSLTAGFGFTVTGIPVDLDNPPPVVGLPSLTAVGLGDGIASRVTVYNPDGSVRTQFTPFDPGFLGGTRAAVARDPRGNRVVVVPGPGRFPDARVFSADDGTEVATFQPFEVGFTGGLFVASADIDRDGYEDYVFSADVGGGPRVKITSGKTGATLQDFFGIEDTNFRGGARVAVGDVNGDGTPDLIVAAGVGGGPRVAVYDGTTVIGVRNTPRRLVGDFFAFEQALRNGAYVAAGDVDGDGKAEVVLGGGPGGGPRVRVLSGADLLNNRQTAVSDFFAGPQTDRGGVKVTVRDLSGQTGTTGAKSDLVAASGSGDGSRVTVYLGSQLRPGQPPAARGFDDLSGFRGGVFVG
ncbi:hypothetical protein DP116_13325 [Brasilonema bromeliae SPC951]|uniref:Big-1 domain-containing protein n=1 Tax=Brasilonema bromeliae SPC951 TaxID=385972 RepID=A0ABX1P7W0_9CYAN|nr:hypothetical protein [Brasilonema bromeliae SPC951]